MLPDTFAALHADATREAARHAYAMREIRAMQELGAQEAICAELRRIELDTHRRLSNRLRKRRVALLPGVYGPERRGRPLGTLRKPVAIRLRRMFPEQRRAHAERMRALVALVRDQHLTYDTFVRLEGVLDAYWDACCHAVRLHHILPAVPQAYTRALELAHAAA